MSILVISEHEKGVLKKSTLSVVTAALQLSQITQEPVIGLAVGDWKLAEALAQVVGIQQVLWVTHSDSLLTEQQAALIARLAAKHRYILAPATAFGKDLLPRVAGILNTSQISDVIKIIDHQTFIRPIYAGNALATVRSTASIKLLTIRAIAFDPSAVQAQQADIVSYKFEFPPVKASFLSQQATDSPRPELTTARVIVAGGRALQENFKLLELLADQLGAAIGATRAAVDAGFAPNDYQIGQTGKIVAPELYIAVGISGAIQHLAGMRESKIIVAINKDPKAPIFNIADYGLVGDLYEVIPELIEYLK